MCSVCVCASSSSGSSTCIIFYPSLSYIKLLICIKKKQREKSSHIYIWCVCVCVCVTASVDRRSHVQYAKRYMFAASYSVEKLRGMPKRKKRAVAAPLKNNGQILVHYGKGNVLKYNLVSIHYDFDPESGVAVCTLNEPRRLNALTQNQMWEYFLILRHVERDSRVNIVVWTGRGRAFSSGADLSGRAPPPNLPEEVMDWFVENRIFSPGHTDPDRPDMALKCLTLAFWDFTKISIVAVNGLAVGGAANIALANYHDFVLASTQARFMYPFSKIGLTPELGSSYILPRIAGMANAKKVLMKGDWFSAKEAKEMGLVSEVLEPSMLVPRAMQLANELSKKNQAALRLGKRLINSHLRKDMDTVMDIENKTIDEAVQARFSSSKL